MSPPIPGRRTPSYVSAVPRLQLVRPPTAPPPPSRLRRAARQAAWPAVVWVLFCLALAFSRALAAVSP